jgi:hypothetical protein
MPQYNFTATYKGNNVSRVSEFNYTHAVINLWYDKITHEAIIYSCPFFRTYNDALKHLRLAGGIIIELKRELICA